MTRPAAHQLEQLAKLTADLRPILADTDRITRQMLDWSADAVKGIDTSKVRVSGGSISNPVEAEALRRLDGRPDIWRHRATRFAAYARWCAHQILEGAAHGAEFARAAREVIYLARLVNPQPATDPGITARLINENSTTGHCEWCKHHCRGSRSIGIDGRLVDDRRHRVTCSDRWSIGLCRACHAFLRRRIPEGVALSDSAHHELISAERLDEIRRERDAHLSRSTPAQSTGDLEERTS